MSLMPFATPHAGQRRGQFNPRGYGIGGMGGQLGGGGLTPYGANLGGAMGLFARHDPNSLGGNGLQPLGYGGLGVRGRMDPRLATPNLMNAGVSPILPNFNLAAQQPYTPLPPGALGAGLGRHRHHKHDPLIYANLGTNSCGCQGGASCGHVRPDRMCPHDQCIEGCSTCSGNDNSSTSSTLSIKDLKTKDIVVRGKTYKIRKSFLAESSKFETDIVKLVDKKSEETIPNNVVQMLISYINTESCKSQNLLDIVTLNILASNLGVKSAIEYSLAVLKKHDSDYDINAYELTHICLAVMESSKVDGKLTDWLKKFLMAGGRDSALGMSKEYRDMIVRKPELQIHLLQLMGKMEKDDIDEECRII